MGYPYHELIPPAILLDHPGLTKEEFIDALDKTHGSGYTKFKAEDPWDSHNEKEKDFHEGPEGLAQILNLGESMQFRIFQAPDIDGNGMVIQPVTYSPRLEQDYETHEFSWIHEVTVNSGNNVGQSQIINVPSWSKLKSGEYLASLTGLGVGYFEDALIQEVLEETRLSRRSQEGELRYRLKVLPVSRQMETETFDSEEAVYQKWPQFRPDNRYDFTQPKGHFRLSHDFSGENYFRWIMEEGRYFLDPETFDLIPASWQASNWDCMGYTDLIATAEAIKHKAWKLLSRKGLDHYAVFLRDFPDSKERIEKAIRDSHLALASKKYGETVNDLLRMRLFP